MSSTPPPFPANGILHLQQAFLSIGRVMRVVGADGGLLAFVKHPLLVVREEFNIHADESETRLLMRAKVRQALRVNACYDLFDGATGARLFTLRRHLLRGAFLGDLIDILDDQDREIGRIRETAFPFLRRLFGWLPRHWRITLGEDEVGRVDQAFTLFKKRLTIDLGANDGRLDPRVAVVGALIVLWQVESLAESGA